MITGILEEVLQHVPIGSDVQGVFNLN